MSLMNSSSKYSIGAILIIALVSVTIGWTVYYMVSSPSSMEINDISSSSDKQVSEVVSSGVSTPVGVGETVKSSTTSEGNRRPEPIVKGDPIDYGHNTSDYIPDPTDKHKVI